VIPMSKYSIFTSAERIVLPVTGDLRSWPVQMKWTACSFIFQSTVSALDNGSF
jgi:hypothetical protein